MGKGTVGEGKVGEGKVGLGKGKVGEGKVGKRKNGKRKSGKKKSGIRKVEKGKLEKESWKRKRGKRKMGKGKVEKGKVEKGKSGNNETFVIHTNECSTGQIMGGKKWEGSKEKWGQSPPPSHPSLLPSSARLTASGNITSGVNMNNATPSSVALRRLRHPTRHQTHPNIDPSQEPHNPNVF